MGKCINCCCNPIFLCGKLCCKSMFKIFCCCTCCCPDDSDNESSAANLAIIFPPLGVYYKSGFAIEFWICLLLTTIGYLPGLFYAIYVIHGGDS